MVFNSIVFIVFFAFVCLFLALTNIKKLKNAWGVENMIRIRKVFLLVCSYIFYGWADWKCCSLVLAITVIAYVCARLIEKGKHRKLYAAISVILPLLILGVFKYFNFFISSFRDIFGLEDAGALNLLLPVGISFFTFQGIAYTVDVYRKTVPAERDFLTVALYIAFFPKLLTGPIVKAKNFLPQLKEDRSVTIGGLAQGAQIFMFGLFKKIVIADNISVFVGDVFGKPKEYGAVSLIFAVIAYSIQIYCDFSGYSDMAIGCAKCIGYDIDRNFNMPYIAKNIGEFWKRWHISLSEWLQNYLYIPLGGNRKGKLRTYLNNFLTMLIGGLWHGAAWTFVAWGALHGAALCVHKAFRSITKRDKSYRGTAVGRIAGAVFTYVFVCFCWIFFRADSFENAWEVIKGIFTWQPGVLHISSHCVAAIILIAVCFAIAAIRSKKLKLPTVEGFYPFVNLNTVFGLTVFIVFTGITLALAFTGSNPFIYFQF